MWAFLSSLVAAIPAAATSNAGFAAFAVAAIVYIATVWRVSRNKQILANLEKLSPKDRLPALELEMGGVRLASGISPEQWVRSRIHRYYFLAFAITLLLIVVLASLLFVYRSGSADISVDLKQSQLNSNEGWGFVSVVSPAKALDTRTDDNKKLRYTYSKVENRLFLKPELGYLESQRRGEPVNRFSWWNDPFTWDFPSLSVKVANNTRHDLVLSEIVFRMR